MSFLPLFLTSAAGPVILVGSGSAALAKLHLLRALGAHVRWYSPQIDVAEELLIANTRIEPIGINIGEPDEEDLADAVAVVSAAGGEIDQRVAARARALRIPVNVVDRPDLSTFIVPAIVDRGQVVVAISTGGASPVLARRLRERFEALLPSRIGDFAQFMMRHRPRVDELRQRRSGFSLRRFWEEVIDGAIGAAFLAGRDREAEVMLDKAIDAARTGIRKKSEGAVYLVGAGPGDPDLLTLRALHALQAADIIFYDGLIREEMLALARRDAERVFVGKRLGAPGLGQAEINRRLVEAARAGRCVVRLKGGDPFIFGRGGEELEYLQNAGISVRVVPGITAALGCAAEAGLPLTLRKEATRLIFVKANAAEGAESLDWAGLSDPATTIVVYMGLSTARSVCSGLIAEGRDPLTPTGVYVRGTYPDNSVRVGHLRDLPRMAADVAEGPALIVIGEVVARTNAWAEINSAMEVAV